MSEPSPPPAFGSLASLRFRGPGGSGALTPFGAHALQWQPAGHRPVLYLSPRAVLDGRKAIRGGIPVCFPWFGSGPDGTAQPAHGTARTATWEPTEQRPDGATLRLNTEGFAFELSLAFGTALDLAVKIVRTGDSPAPFELALHSYFCVSDATRAAVTGLGGAHRLDQLTGERAVQGDEPVRFVGEFDRLFTGCTGPQTLHDPGDPGDADTPARRIRVSPTNLPSAIVWNPHAAKAASMADLGEDQWPRFVCIESARVREDALTLQPGEGFEASVRVEVLAETSA